MMDKAAKILVVGHGDILEQAVTDHFRRDGFDQVFSSTELALDCAIQSAVLDFFQTHRPAYVVLGSTRSGGIQANLERPADFCYHNTASAANVFFAARQFGVTKLLYWGSSCVYPREAPQPYQPAQILSGPPEETSEPYAVAKLAGITMARAFRRQYGVPAVAAIPATVYGPGGDTDLQQAHVMGALIHKFHEAVRQSEPEVAVWGSGRPRREFLHREDLAAACRLLLEDYDGEDVINVGTGEEVTIESLAGMVAAAAGFTGKISFDASRPDGAPQKLLDNQALCALGWKPRVTLEEGIRQTMDWYQQEGKS